MKLLNNPRSRSLLAGTLGGLVGWLLAELLFASKLGNGTWTATIGIGATTGLGIGAVLGLIEGVAIQAWQQAQRGLMIGLVLGAIGGLLGATFGQVIDQSVASAGGGGLFDPDMAGRIQGGGGQAGEIEIGLLWDNRNDLDLHVIDPSEEHIFFNHRRSTSGGELDIDRNAACGDNVTNRPVEHVVWQSNAPLGEYQIIVDHYANCGGSDPTSFKVQLKIGNNISTYTGETRHGDSPTRLHTFTHDGLATGSEGSAGVLPFIARVLGWVLFGALVGVSQGLVRRSAVAVRNAGAGGALGGAVGGIAFLLIAQAMGASSPAASRAAGFAIVGAAVGLFIVLVEQALSAALVIVSGRYEGREIFLDRDVMRIGRGELLEVYIGGDAEMKGHHATVEKQASNHIISAAEGSITVNGVATTGQGLANGDLIEVGATRLTYRWRAASSSPVPVDETTAVETGKVLEPRSVITDIDKPESGIHKPAPPPPRRRSPAPPGDSKWKAEDDSPPSTDATGGAPPDPDSGRQGPTPLPPPPRRN